MKGRPCLPPSCGRPSLSLPPDSPTPLESSLPSSGASALAGRRGHRRFWSEGETACPCLPAEIAFSIEKAPLPVATGNEKKFGVLLKALHNLGLLLYIPSMLRTCQVLKSRIRKRGAIARLPILHLSSTCR